MPIDWMANLRNATDVRRNHSVRSAPDSKANYPWIDDATCRHFSVQFAKNKSFPKWALTSFPGSGVTWTRQLIEGVTGIYTGTVYGTIEPPIIDGDHHGNEAERECGCTILIKDHGYPESHAYMGTNRPYENRGILILRNPFDALFTYGHYLWSGNDQTGTASPNVFNGTNWDDHVSYVADEWAEHADRWIQYIQEGTVIFYERLLQDTENELRRLLKAIHFVDANHPPVDPERMRCTLQHKDRVDRKRSNKPKVSLRSMDHSKFMSSIERVQASLSKKGWPLLPLHLYDLHTPVDALRVSE
ncbi:sialate:O-sulfotransferase 1-like [Daphnia carinata]|uniref:sialate:O-sulfotransferase 1-like n=1 Tax=Daphnia carinata TaxID=120202 RepID=UPI0028689529|nr:sialate:O-sulfotransferase 1-like [Daphnia carinata]